MDYNKLAPLRLLIVAFSPIGLDARTLACYPEMATSWVHNSQQALACCQPLQFDCALLQTASAKHGQPDEAMALARNLRQQDPYLAIIMVSDDYCLDETALGGLLDDFLVTPLCLAELPFLFNKARQRRHNQQAKLSQNNAYNRKLRQLSSNLLDRVGQPENMARLLADLHKIETPHDIYQEVTELAACHLKARQAALMVLDHASGSLYLFGQQGFGSQFLKQPVAALGKGICGKVAAEGQPMLGQASASPARDILPIRGKCMALPVKMRGMVFGVLLLADKQGPFTPHSFTLASFLLSKLSMEIENTALYEYTSKSLYTTLAALISAMEAKDLYTSQHSQRVTSISLLIAQAMGLNSSWLDSLRFAAYLHDIGKIGIKDVVLCKNDKLSSEECATIKQHPIIGDNIISALDLPWQERAVILHHHERWDGKGYPHGLKGQAIPLLARIAAVADTFDAITSNRPYRVAGNLQEAKNQIIAGAGSQFDPQIVDYFKQSIDRW